MSSSTIKGRFLKFINTYCSDVTSLWFPYREKLVKSKTLKCPFVEIDMDELVAGDEILYAELCDRPQQTLRLMEDALGVQILLTSKGLPFPSSTSKLGKLSIIQGYISSIGLPKTIVTRRSFSCSRCGWNAVVNLEYGSLQCVGASCKCGFKQKPECVPLVFSDVQTATIKENTTNVEVNCQGALVDELRWGEYVILHGVSSLGYANLCMLICYV